MIYKSLFTFALLYIVGVLFLPSEVLASTNYGGQEFNENTNEIQNFLYGPILLLIASLAGAWAIMKAIMGNLTPLITFFAVCLGAGLMRTFVNGIFQVSGMLLP